jgi:NodT family efflux transporter outer membrane factor (OMF) lipoprotein
MKALLPATAMAIAIIVLALSACAVGPNYRRPATPTASAYKEDQGWKPATPGQIPAGQPWWSIYDDPVLDNLERQVEVSNQTLKASEAAYRAARAAVDVDRGSLFPDIGLTGSDTRSGGGGTIVQNGVALGSTGGHRTSFSAGAQGTWTLDVWGRIRRTIESDQAKAKASAADVAAALLSAQITLAEDYFQLRAADEQRRLYKASIEAFQTSLTISQNRVKAGVTTLADVYSAETELESTQALDINVMLTRAKLEHAIAVLVGKNPEDLGVGDGPLTATVPVVPAGLPSDLLERRPDVAASERAVASFNALIGVAESAWFPSLTLSGSIDYTSAAFEGLLGAHNAVWSFGPQLAETVFNGGARLAAVHEARANYDESVATYRETVLAAFQQVEDNLSSLRVLEQQQTLQETAVADARRSEALTLNQYKQGITDYATLLTAQIARLNAEISLLGIRSQRLVSSVDLISALGGGWNASRLALANSGVPAQ